VHLERLTTHQKSQMSSDHSHVKEEGVDNEKVHTCVPKDHCTVHMFELIETVRFYTLQFQIAFEKQSNASTSAT